MSPEHTFLQQLKKVAKKRRSPTLSLILRSSIKTGREYAFPTRSHSKCIHAFCPVLISGTRGAMSRENNHFLRLQDHYNYFSFNIEVKATAKPT